MKVGGLNSNIFFILSKFFLAGLVLPFSQLIKVISLIPILLVKFLWNNPCPNLPLLITLS